MTATETTAAETKTDTTNVAGTIKTVATDVAARLPEVATTSRTVIERANREMQGGSDELLVVGSALTFGLAGGLLTRRWTSTARRRGPDAGGDDAADRHRAIGPPGRAIATPAARQLIGRGGAAEVRLPRPRPYGEGTVAHRSDTARRNETHG